MGCIMTPMPNHLSTCLSLFYYSSFDEWGRCGEMSGVEEKKKKRDRRPQKQCEKQKKKSRTDQGRRTC